MQQGEWTSCLILMNGQFFKGWVGDATEDILLIKHERNKVVKLECLRMFCCHLLPDAW